MTVASPADDHVVLVLTRCRHGTRVQRDVADHAIAVEWVEDLHMPAAATWRTTEEQHVAPEIDRAALNVLALQCAPREIEREALGDAAEIQPHART